MPDVKSENLLDNVTPGVRLLLESESDSLSRDHRELQQFYNEAKTKASLTEPEEAATPLVFPHALTSRIREKIDEEILIVQQENKELLDQEYDEYMKHRNVLSHITQGLRGGSPAHRGGRVPLRD